MNCKNHGNLDISEFSVRKTGYIPNVCKNCERKKAREHRKGAYESNPLAILSINKNSRLKKRGKISSLQKVKPGKSSIPVSCDEKEIFQKLLLKGYIPKSPDLSLVYKKLSSSKIQGKIPQSYIGLDYLDSIFTHRFLAKTEGLKSFHESFHCETDVINVIRYIRSTNRDPSLEIIIRNLKFNTRIPSHFFPGSSAALLNTFGIGKDVLDPFAGWGGRALGALCSQVKSFKTLDLQELSLSGCKKMLSDFSEYTKVNDFSFIHDDSLDFMNRTNETYDLIFTSPPFMDTENYGNGTSRSSREWSQFFVIPFVNLCKRVLRSDGTVMIHGQDRPKVPVLTTLITGFLSSGFKIRGEYKYGKTPGQSVILFGVS